MLVCSTKHPKPSNLLMQPVREFKDMKYTIQVAPEDCTGCSLCVSACPKTDIENPALKMVEQPPLRETEAENWDFFLAHPQPGPNHTETDPAQGFPIPGAPV